MNGQPASTYRLQLNAEFDLESARGLVSYLHDLGVDWLYLSPVFAARRGSPHGYDVIDPLVVNPEIGGREALDRLAKEAHAAGLGLLLDIVPNHQAATTQNPRWVAMLRDGRGSTAARWFDVDWSGNDGVEPGELLWPILERELDEEIADGALVLEVDPHGARVLRYGSETLPIAGEMSGDLVRILDAQHYRLAQWRSGGRFRNYRRFFDISELVGIRVEDEDVMEASHGLIGDLLAEGVADGLRVDHVDGLADPAGYLDRLRALAPEAFLVVEKILGPDEILPLSWPVAGTTGYEIADVLTAVMIDPAGRARLEDAFLAEQGGVRFEAVERRAKREVLFGLFEAEWSRLRALLEPLGESSEALASVTVALGVYRTYLTSGTAGADDRRRIESAAERASAPAATGADAVAVARVASFLLGDPPDHAPAAARAEIVRRWQQLSGAVMAKGHEDTASYRYPALLAQAEVGSDPGDGASDAVERFHRRVAPHRGLVTTTTHDTKRSEDVRCRIAVLSERADAFEVGLARWRGRVRPSEGVTPAEQRFVAQTLLGAWPLTPDGFEEFGSRISAYLTKAMREAKQQTSWLAPDEAHEAEVIALAERSIAGHGRRFRDVFGELLDDLAFYGAVNSLAQLTWKVALPGTVDLYRGTELWDLSLTDPDNRRAVDFDARRALLADDRDDLQSGALKLRMTTAGLHARRDDPGLFVDGAYVPLAVEGRHRDHLLAFARRAGDRWAVAIGPRLVADLVPRGAFPVGAVWGDTALVLPAGAPNAWRDVYTGAPVTTTSVATILTKYPAALLRSSGAAQEHH